MFNAFMAALKEGAAGTTPPGGKKPKTFANEQEKIAYWMGLRKKYGDKWLAKRMQWMDWADQKLPNGSTPKELAVKYAKKYGLDPEYVLSSAMEEGIGLRYTKAKGEDLRDDISQAYANANSKGELKGFDVDGFRSYGLDTIGDRYNSLVKGGYLDDEFAKRMKPYKAYNEIEYKKLQQGLPAKAFTTAAFADDDAAMEAKAAIMAQERDAFNKYAKDKGVTLSPKAQKFFMLAAYNGGAGIAQKMLEDYNNKGLLKDDAFLDRSEGGQVYENVMPRLAGGEMFRGEGYFDEEQPEEEIAQTAQPGSIPGSALLGAKGR